MKINNKKKITDFKGKPVKTQDGELLVGEALSNILLNDKTAGKYKAYSLAEKFSKEATVDLDNSDASLVKKAVESSEYYMGNLVAGFLLTYFETLK